MAQQASRGFGVGELALRAAKRELARQGVAVVPVELLDHAAALTDPARQPADHADAGDVTRALRRLAGGG